MKKIIAASLMMLSATPAAASDTTPWGALRGGYDFGNKGVAVGAAVGVDTDIGSKGFVGASLGFDDSAAKECVQNYLNTGAEVCVKANRELTAELRLGIRASDDVKLYAIGGYSDLKLKATATYGANTASESGSISGFKFGFGYEQIISKNLFTRLEYRHGSYQDDVSTDELMPTIGIKF